MTAGSLLLFDVTLAFTLVAAAAGVLLARDLFQGIVLFIVFGLLLAVSWCRLDAVDVALAEAAIGAGLTGALLLNTWAATRGLEAWRPEPEMQKQKRRIPNDAMAARKETSPVRRSEVALSEVSPSAASPVAGVESPLGSRSVILLIVPLVLAACAMAAVVAPLAFATDTPRVAMEEAMPHSGVANPVTAVLLNFRAYDTLLEVAVLLAAILAVIPLLTPARETRDGTPPDPVLRTFMKWMVPITAMVAVYVLWTGTKAPGGAFQSAAMLCAAGVLLLVGGRQIPTWDRRRWRVLLTGGLALFLLVAFLGMLGGGNFLQYHAGWAGASIIFIEAALSASLAFILIRLFSSSSPSASGSQRGGSSHRTLTAAPQEQK